MCAVTIAAVHCRLDQLCWKHPDSDHAHQQTRESNGKHDDPKMTESGNPILLPQVSLEREALASLLLADHSVGQGCEFTLWQRFT